MSTEERPPLAGERRPRVRGRLYRRLHANPALALTTKVVVTTVGVLVLLAGLVMMVAPGPGIVGIVVGLGILATEYEWARRWLEKARGKAHEARARTAAMDPRQRRRRIILGVVVLVLLTAAVVSYVVLYDWPRPAVAGWDWLQRLTGWVPDLPGM